MSRCRRLPAGAEGVAYYAASLLVVYYSAADSPIATTGQLIG